MNESERPRFLDRFLNVDAEPGDCGHATDILPHWVDIPKLKRAQQVWREHCPSIITGLAIGQTMISQVPRFMRTLIMTGGHANPTVALRRGGSFCRYVLSWYEGDIWDPEDESYKKVNSVRGIHKAVTVRLKQEHPGEDNLWISAFNMTLVQFAFISPLVIFKDKIGFHCTPEELDCTIHYWRYIAFRLGSPDKYNLSALPLAELTSTSWEILREVCAPTFKNKNEEFSKMMKTEFDAYTYFLPGPLHFDAAMNMAFDLMELPEFKKRLDFRGKVCSSLMNMFPSILKSSCARSMISPGYRNKLDKNIRSYFESQRTKA